MLSMISIVMMELVEEENAELNKNSKFHDRNSVCFELIINSSGIINKTIFVH